MSRASVAGRIGAFWRGKTNKLVIGIEIALSLFIVLSMGVTLLHQVDHGKQNNVFLRDFRFAEHKAFEILEELRIRVANRTGVDAQSLERFDDHEKLVHVLSVAKDKVGADPALTGNVKEGESWLWARSISVEELASRRVPELRTVTVKLFCKRGGGEYRQLVEVSETMGTAASSEPAQQVFDLYMIAIENVPGLWRPLSTIRPFIENRIKELETRNPGLELRAHWITKQSYGRDPTYAPQFSSTRVNSTSGTGRADETSGVYFYPNALYGAARVGAVLSLDGIAKNHGSAVENPHPYTLADQYNHAMRLPQERELFDARVRSGQEKPSEPTLRLLLEDLASHPSRHANAILVNLHGAALPMPPIRNFSDAARKPSVLPGIRVVTHPEKLRYARVGEDDSHIALRVYAYKTDTGAGSPDLLADEPITLQIMDLDLSRNINTGKDEDGGLIVEMLEGGVDRGDGDFSYKAFQRARTQSRLARQMRYEARFVNGRATGERSYTLLELYNTPVVAPKKGRAGLGRTKRLYGMEYIPCSTERENDFSRNLASRGDAYKNTARWRIRIPSKALAKLRASDLLLPGDRFLELRTRIGKLAAVAAVSGDTHLSVAASITSRSYVYWTKEVAGVPFTERFQFLGDPRHCPYADLKQGGSSFAAAYNWYFDDFKDGKIDSRRLWPGIGAYHLADGWMQRLNADYPRFAQLLRTGLSRSKAIWVSMPGITNSLLCLGGEIGLSSDTGKPKALQLDLSSYGQVGTGKVSDFSTESRPKASFGTTLVKDRDTTWWSMPWLGELYPDELHSVWQQSGNLPVARFFRQTRDKIRDRLPPGTRLSKGSRYAGFEGSTSLLNCGSTWSSFHHQYADGSTGSLARAGRELLSTFHLKLEKSLSIPLPFRLDTSWHGGVGPEWRFQDFYPRNTARLVKSYILQDRGAHGLSLVSSLGKEAETSAYYLLNGFGTDFSAKHGANLILAAAMDALFERAKNTDGSRFALPPIVEFLRPIKRKFQDGEEVLELSWDVRWERWDGKEYVVPVPSDFSVDEAEIIYLCLYSTDGGVSFRYVQDDSLVPSERAARLQENRITDRKRGPETLSWRVPSTIKGNTPVLLRVEAYLRAAALHHAFHEFWVKIGRHR